MTDISPSDRHALADIERIHASVEHMRAEQEHWRAQQEKWRRNSQRETMRIVLYGVLVAAGLLVAGATVWEQIRPETTAAVGG